MNTRKYFLLAASFILLAGLMTAAIGQRKSATGPTLSPPEPVLTIVKVNAIEIADGVVAVDKNNSVETMFGYSFLGKTSGGFPGSIMLSMNCAPAEFVPGGSNELTGGAWSLPVYMPTTMRGSSNYAGSLYGTIGKGKMDWDKTGTIANLYFVLTIEGGTLTWNGMQGYATFTGTLVEDEKTLQKTITGDLVFDVLSPAP
jgi:hypothetical protein